MAKEIIPEKITSRSGEYVTLTNPYVRYVDEQGRARNKNTGEFSLTTSAADAAHSLGSKITTAKGFLLDTPSMPGKVLCQLCDASSPSDDDEPLALFYVCNEYVFESRINPITATGRVHTNGGMA